MLLDVDSVRIALNKNLMFQTKLLDIVRCQ